MKKALLLALPLIALTFAVACKNKETAVTEQPAVTDEAAGNPTPAAPVAAQPTEKKGK